MSNQNRTDRDVVEKAISATTQNALSKVTDPYHDEELRNTGFPDGCTTISTVQRFFGRKSIQCPYPPAAGMTWMFHIFTTSLHKLTSNAAMASTQGNVITPTPVAYKTGPIMIRYTRFINGNYDSTGDIYDAIGDPALVNVNTNTNLTQRRTVSLGFELHNTTAELYKQGALTVYRVNPIQRQINCFISSGADNLPYSTEIIGNYPTSIDEANQYPNTRTWNASEGVYAVALPTPVNPYSLGAGTNWFMKGVAGNGNALMQEQMGLLAGSIQLNTFSPLANVGVMSSLFTDANQSFMLDYRQWLETVPDPRDLVQLSYATTAPKLDATFVKLYTAMFNNIPPGVPVNFNSAGEWFRRILTVARKALPAVVSLLPGQAKMIGMAAAPVIDKLIGVALDEREESQPLVQPKLKKRKALKTLKLTDKSGRMLPGKRQ